MALPTRPPLSAIDCDIFCQVVDNFGDVGVCWRLARALSVERGYAVRLWIDDLATFQRMYDAIDAGAERQRFQGVDIRRWSDPFPAVEPAAVVIETFGCRLPESYLEAMARRPRPPPWVDVEHLSAEAWIEGCHLRSSPHAVLPLARLFYFPGFVATSGGLLRERALAARRAAVRADPLPLWRMLGIEPPARDARCISLFCYRAAPVGALLDALAREPRPTLCLVPAGQAAEAVAAWAGEGPLGHPAEVRRGSLRVALLPFLTQDTYDELLCACELNFVRGEDSFVRGQLAGRPIVWHIYPQDGDAHWTKLEAFLDRYADAFDPAAASALRAAHAAWNGRGAIDAAWPALAIAGPALAAGADEWLRRLEALPEVGATLDGVLRGML